MVRRLLQTPQGIILSLCVLCVLGTGFACKEHAARDEKTGTAYRPGLGEFMTTLQMHHAKLWFAGKNKNWPLAKFEHDELVEIIADLEKFHAGRGEIRTLSRLASPLADLEAAIKNQKVEIFQQAFRKVTENCNACHRETEHGFINIIVPEQLPVSNQDFRPMPVQKLPKS